MYMLALHIRLTSIRTKLFSHVTIKLNVEGKAIKILPSSECHVHYMALLLGPKNSNDGVYLNSPMLLRMHIEALIVKIYPFHLGF